MPGQPEPTATQPAYVRHQFRRTPLRAASSTARPPPTSPPASARAPAASAGTCATSPNSCIKKQTGRDTKRERWWRRVAAGNDLRIANFPDDPESRGALPVSLHKLVRLHFNRVTDCANGD
ncbi:hypothetical protein [Streptomyces sp. WAC 06725]|uniref:hypothetical protein n=1 Tax=Streptomyces sp. WAC 06725 TaxID=2203209 RepID=UPI000F74B74C|nr:hypothetical protein [Streptomyces sp. WAC 06725]